MLKHVNVVLIGLKCPYQFIQKFKKGIASLKPISRKMGNKLWCLMEYNVKWKLT